MLGAAVIAVSAGSAWSTTQEAGDRAAQTRAALDRALDTLGEQDRTRVRIVEYWNAAIWLGTGIRYLNDWNLNPGTLMRHSREASFIYLARDSMHRAEAMRAVPTDGVPQELVDFGGRIADGYESMAFMISERMAGRNATMDPQEMERAGRELEALRVKLNREHGLTLHKIEVINEG